MERADSKAGKAYDPVGYEDIGGVRYLQFGTEWVQGAMRLGRPDWLELEYVRLMVAWTMLRPKPASIAILGLGAGSLARFCRRQFTESRIEVVELNPAVVQVCEGAFGLPARGPLFDVQLRDAMEWAAEPGPKFDIVMVDLYDAQAQGPVLDTPEFYAGVAARLAPRGLAAVNLFGDHPSYGRNVRALESAFAHVGFLPEVEAGNVIALAGAEPWGIAWDCVEAMRAMDRRAREVSEATGLPTSHWPDALAFALADRGAPRRGAV